MSKPINIQAQRVAKVIDDSVSKLKVLSMLNTEFFKEIEEIRKKDETEILAHFGPRVGKLLIK